MICHLQGSVSPIVKVKGKFKGCNLKVIVLYNVYEELIIAWLCNKGLFHVSDNPLYFETQEETSKFSTTKIWGWKWCVSKAMKGNVLEMSLSQAWVWILTLPFSDHLTLKVWLQESFQPSKPCIPRVWKDDNDTWLTGLLQELKETLYKKHKTWY